VRRLSLFICYHKIGHPKVVLSQSDAKVSYHWPVHCSPRFLRFLRLFAAKAAWEKKGTTRREKAQKAQKGKGSV
jgi:hypothetical protein